MTAQGSGPEWFVKGGYSHGFKPPTLKQITPGYQEDEGPFTYLANPALRPETSDSIEVGAAWDSPAAGVQAMLFDSRVDDLIVPVATGLPGPRAVFRFDNVDRARLRGIELSTRWQLARAWTLSANYQYLDAKDGNGQRLERRPRQLLGTWLEWRAGPWHAALQVDSAADQLLPSVLPGQPPQPVPSLTYVGASVLRDLGRGLNLLIGVNNAGDVNPVEKSPPYSWGAPPRTLRVALRGDW